jgi:HPt (histidine-containing phosphotransfer) domain-containing protein
MLTSDGPTLLEQIGAAVGAGDAPAVGRLAHSLKGMISNFCAPAIQVCALELEKMGKAGDLAGAAPALRHLRERVGALTGELQDFIRART